MNKDTVIFGVDFKDDTIKLCSQVAKYARKLKSSVTLVHAVEYIPYYSYFPYDEEKINDFHDQEINGKLEKLKKKFAESGIDVEDSIVEKGKTYELLCQVADKKNANAIILGVGQSYLMDEMIGSTTEKVCRMARQKVIVLNDSEEKNSKKILCAFDFTDNSIAALQSAVRFTHFFGTKLTVLHVLSTPDMAANASKHFRDKVKKIINNELTGINAGKEIDFDLEMTSGFPVIEILKFAELNEVGLISIGSSGHSKFTRFFLGSTVAKIIRRSPCTIVVSPKEIL